MLKVRLRLLVAAVWAGSLWTVGYLVAPTLFATLERTLAGQVAGSMFGVEAWLSIGCAGAMLLLERRRTMVLVVLAMLACTLASHFGVQPLMAEAHGTPRFGMLHGISSVIYLLESLLAGFLLLTKPPA